MIQVYFNTGASLDVTTIPEFQILNTQQLPMEEIRILVDTSIARTIILPYSTNFPVRNIKITVFDITGGAGTNNITIQVAADTPVDTINGLPLTTVSSAYEAVQLTLLNTRQWAVFGGGGGGTALYVSMTYAQLITNIGGNTLVPGQRILLTDYRTAHYIQYSGTPPSGIGNEEVNLGAIEPLLLTAISDSQVSIFAESLTNTQDIILYRAIMNDGYYEYCAAQGKGCIIYRLNTLTSVARDYDWREVIFRRWETSIGSGLFFSFQPVAGAAFVDYLAFPTGVPNSTIVQSPLGSAISSEISFPYWLDNTVIKFDKIADNNLGVCAANHFEQADAAFPLPGTFLANVFQLTAYNVAVQYQIARNNINNLFSSIIVGGDDQTFSGNNCNGMDALTCPNVAFNYIDDIQGSSFIALYGNTGGKLDNNNMPLYNCVANIFEEMSDNSSGGDIIGNIVRLIKNNTNQGAVLNNIGNVIQNNSNNGAISDNNVRLIDNNSCLGITNNIGDEISDNSNTAAIFSNICRGVVGNSNVGAISSNVGYSIGLNTITGDIIGNNVFNINQNSTIAGVTGIGYNSGYSIQSCSLSNVAGKPTVGVELCNNVRLNGSTIEDAISAHTFLDAIGSKTITPTATMMAGTNPTRSLLDEGDGKYYIMLLSAGVLSFPTAITN